MTEETDLEEEIEKIRIKVEERVKQEAREEPLPGKPEVSFKWILNCLRANELGYGLLFARLNVGKFLFDTIRRRWLVWAGHYWMIDTLYSAEAAVEETVVQEYIRGLEEVGKRIGEAAKKGDKSKRRYLETLLGSFKANIRRLRSRNGRSACLEFAYSCGDKSLAERHDNFDTKTYLLACPNGVVDLRSAKFRDGRPEDRITKAIPVKYQDIEGEACLWEDTLRSIFEPDPELVDYIRRLFGYIILGSKREHIFPIFWGQGRNGKGLILEVISEILGPLAAPIPAEMLLAQFHNKNPSAPSPDIMALKGLRLAWVSEVDDNRLFSPSKVKWLTGGDMLTGRSPHDKDPTKFWPTHTLILLTNSKPRAPADDFALWERMHLVPFRLSFVAREPVARNERKAIRGLSDRIIEEEAAGVLSWLVRGSLEYQERGLDPPPVVREATEEYRKEEDLLGEWIEADCHLDERLETKASDLYESFASWFSENISSKKDAIPKMKAFSRMLGRRFEKKRRRSGVYYRGIQLRGVHEVKH